MNTPNNEAVNNFYDLLKESSDGTHDGVVCSCPDEGGCDDTDCPDADCNSY